MKTYCLKREIPLEEGFDLVVAGGGPGGALAAIAAGRMGARVLLLEATGCLGGMGTSGLVCAFDPMADGEKMLVGGLMRELVETLYARGFMAPGINPDCWRKEYHKWSQFQSEGFKLVLDEMAMAAGVEVRFFTRVIDAQAEGGLVDGVVTANVEGYRYIRARAFIDATGDAVLSKLCGAAYHQAGKNGESDPMPATLAAIFAGVDWGKTQLATQTTECVRLLEEEFEQGRFEQCDRHFVGLSAVNHSVGYMNGGHIFHLDATDIQSLSQGMMTGRRIVRQYEAFLRKYSENCENLQLVATGALMGVRESRRVIGEYELNFADYQARRQFPDQIGVFNKFVDIHPLDCSRQEYDRFLREKDDTGRLGPGECFGLPYGILVPRGFGNLWVAGRCCSSDEKVHGSIRVMPACGMMGHAAGVAAVQSIRTGQRANRLNTRTLVETLRQQGAYLPQEQLSDDMTR